MQKCTLAFAMTASLLALTAPAKAEGEHRQLGPHVHGHGSFNVAIEGNKVSMALEVPANDIVGFEHEANDDKQRQAIKTGTATLKNALSLFAPPKAAGCKVVSNEIELHRPSAEEAKHDEHAKHDDHAKDDDHEKHDEHAKHEDHDDHADGEAGQGHSEFHANYVLECAKPANMTALTFDYFKAFPRAKELDVVVLTDKSQNRFEVTREKSVINLGPTM